MAARDDRTPDPVQPDDLQPGGKDPAEGARKPGGADAGDHPEESHLGPAGDPAEG